MYYMIQIPPPQWGCLLCREGVPSQVEGLVRPIGVFVFVVYFIIFIIIYWWSNWNAAGSLLSNSQARILHFQKSQIRLTKWWPGKWCFCWWALFPPRPWGGSGSPLQNILRLLTHGQDPQNCFTNRYVRILDFLYFKMTKCDLAQHSIEFLHFRCPQKCFFKMAIFIQPDFYFHGIFKFISWNWQKSMVLRGHFLGLAVATKWYCPQHIVASTLLKPRFWGTIFRIPPTVCTNRISALPKVEFWTIRVQDFQNILTNQIWESIVSLLRCRFVTTVSQILTSCILSSSSWCCRVILCVFMRAHSSIDSDIRRS